MAVQSYTPGARYMWRTSETKPTKNPDGSPLAVGTIGLDLDADVDYLWDGGTWWAASTSIGAPATAKYLIQTANAALPNAQVLGSLATGYAKVTTTTGVVSTVTSIPSTDITGLGTMAAQNASAVAITGGTITGLTGLGIRDTSAAFDVTIAAVSSVALTAGRTLTIDVQNVARTIALAGSLSFAGAFTTAGAFAITLTATAGTGVTLPTTGTLSTLAGAEELTNKTLTSSVGKGTWTASGTWILPAHTFAGTITSNAAQTWALIAATAAALAITDGTTTMLRLDSRVAVDGTFTVFITPPAQTIVSASGTFHNAFATAAYTTTLTGGVTVDNFSGAGATIGQGTITSGSATTVTTASSLYIPAAPLSGGSVTITTALGIHVASGRSLFNMASISATLSAQGGFGTLQAFDNGNGANFVGVVGSADNNPVRYAAYKTRSTIAGAPATTSVAANDAIYRMRAFAADGTAYELSGVMQFLVQSVVANTSIGTWWELATANASGTETKGLAVDQAQIAYLAKLQVGGTIGALGTAPTPATNNQFSTGSLGSGTTAMFIGNAQITAVSDSRLKTSITPSSFDTGAFFDALEVDGWAWNHPADKAAVNMNTNGRIEAGLVAQKVRALAPWMVRAPDVNCPDCSAGLPCKSGHFLAGNSGLYAHPVITQNVVGEDGRTIGVTTTQEDSVSGAWSIVNEYVLAAAALEIQRLRARLLAAGIK